MTQNRPPPSFPSWLSAGSGWRNLLCLGPVGRGAGRRAGQSPHPEAQPARPPCPKTAFAGRARGGFPRAAGVPTTTRPATSSLGRVNGRAGLSARQGSYPGETSVSAQPPHPSSFLTQAPREEGVKPTRPGPPANRSPPAAGSSAHTRPRKSPAAPSLARDPGSAPTPPLLLLWPPPWQTTQLPAPALPPRCRTLHVAGKEEGGTGLGAREAREAGHPLAGAGGSLRPPPWQRADC